MHEVQLARVETSVDGMVMLKAFYSGLIWGKKGQNDSRTPPTTCRNFSNIKGLGDIINIPDGHVEKEPRQGSPD